MSQSPPRGTDDELTEARRTIVGLRAEVERLQGRLADDQFARQLREVFSLATTAGTIATQAGHSGLLTMILETAAYVISARAASIFLMDEGRGELVVAAALGPKAAEVEQLRVPVGHGIAGLVAVSGQAMAIADPGADPRHASDIARALGYTPQSILCVPLIYGEQVIGVLELLDKEGAASFGAADMEALGLFADQAAVAIEQSRTLRSLAALVGEVLQLLGDTPGQQQLREGAREFARRVEEDPIYRRSLEVARLIQEVARLGEDELKVCQTILRDFADYLRSRPRPRGELWPMG